MGLKSSGLFKKLAQTNINDSDEDENENDKQLEKKDHPKENFVNKKEEIIQETKKVNIDIKNELNESDDLFGFEAPKINLKKSVTLNEKKASIFEDPFETKVPNEQKVEAKSNDTASSSLNTQESELFEGIKTDRSFSEQSFKNVQKVLLGRFLYIVCFSIKIENIQL